MYSWYFFSYSCLTLLERAANTTFVSAQAIKDNRLEKSQHYLTTHKAECANNKF